MFKLIAITNRRLCDTDLIGRIREIKEQGIEVILREKDISEADYSALLKSAGSVTAHSFAGAAAENGIKRLHLPLYMLRENPQLADRFYAGASVHSPEEALEAKSLGAKYVIAGNVFETDCKKGLAGKGLQYIRDVKTSVDIPVYAIGGIGINNIASVRGAGADGACIMSGFMKCEDVSKFVKEINDVLYRDRYRRY